MTPRARAWSFQMGTDSEPSNASFALVPTPPQLAKFKDALKNVGASGWLKDAMLWPMRRQTTHLHIARPLISLLKSAHQSGQPALEAQRARVEYDDRRPRTGRHERKASALLNEPGGGQQHDHLQRCAT